MATNNAIKKTTVSGVNVSEGPSLLLDDGTNLKYNTNTVSGATSATTNTIPKTNVSGGIVTQQNSLITDDGTNLKYNGVNVAGLTGPVQPASAANFSAGTAYSLTNTAAKILLGTTSPSISITAGTWRVRAAVQLEYNAAILAASRAVTLKVRNITDSTDLAHSTIVLNTAPAAITALTQTFGLFQLPVFEVTVAGTKTIEIWGSMNTVPSVGSLDAVQLGTWIFAERIA